MVVFGQIVVGPPGSGKSTYCQGMANFLNELGRQCAVVNLDFANDSLRYEASVDVRDLISLEVAMEEHDLGPNGGLVYCMEYLLAHADWLEEKLRALGSRYVIVDCPGQVELFSHHKCMEQLIGKLKGLDCRLCSVHLIDSYYCCQPATFIAAALLAASTMLRLGLPHVNVLSKVDLLSQYGPLPFKLDFFTEMPDLVPLARYVDAPFQSAEALAFEESHSLHTEGTEDFIAGSDEEDKGSAGVAAVTGVARTQRQRMMLALCDLITDLGIVSFLPMNVEDGETVARVLTAVDKANGYSYAASQAAEIRAAAEKWGDRSWGPREGRQHGAGGGGGSDGAGAGDGGNGEESSNHLGKLFSYVSQELEPAYFRSIAIMEKYCPDDEPPRPLLSRSGATAAEDG